MGRAFAFFHDFVAPSGIISTHSAVIGHAKRLGLFTVQRIFLLDSQSVLTGIQQAQSTHPDVVETLPGILPEVTRQVVRQVPCPVIAGGLITSQAEIAMMRQAGVQGISTTHSELWPLEGRVGLGR